MANVLLQSIDYQIESTPLGTWKRYLYEGGRPYREFTSHRTVGGVPLIHYTVGICPETGRRRTARGFIAIGRRALGVIAIGQFSLGVVSISQFGIGVLLGLGQFTTGLFAVGQFAAGGVAGIGQMATGFVAIGQLAFGCHVFGQIAKQISF